MTQRTRRRRGLRTPEEAELDVTPFMNLMIVLVPVLLLSLVFTHTTVVRLDFPGEATTTSDTPPPARLEVVVRDTGLVVQDDRGGVIRGLPSPDAAAYDLDGLAATLAALKQRVPDRNDITLLVEPGVPYEVLVAVMDRVRARPPAPDERDADGRLLTEAVALFPQVSLGDAPPHAAGEEEPRMSDRAISRRARLRPSRPVTLNLVSLMDIFTILVFFLMVNASEVELLEVDSRIRLPDSVSAERPERDLVLEVDAAGLSIGGTAVVTADELENGEGVLVPLREALERHRRELRLAGGPASTASTDVAGVAPENEGERVTVMGDRAIPYAWLKRVLATCQQADFRHVALAVNQVVGAEDRS